MFKRLLILKARIILKAGASFRCLVRRIVVLKFSEDKCVELASDCGLHVSFHCLAAACSSEKPGMLNYRKTNAGEVAEWLKAAVC